MIYLISFQILIFISYITFIWRKFGVLPSISDSWYELKESNRHSLFTCFLWTVAFPMLFFEIYTGSLWYMFGGFCLFFTGAAAAFKENITKTVHVIGAYGGIGLSAIGLLMNGVPHPVIGIILATLLLAIFKVPNKTLWVEKFSFVYVEAGLIYQEG